MQPSCTHHLVVYSPSDMPCRNLSTFDCLQVWCVMLVVSLTYPPLEECLAIALPAASSGTIAFDVHSRTTSKQGICLPALEGQSTDFEFLSVPAPHIPGPPCGTESMYMQNTPPTPPQSQGGAGLVPAEGWGAMCCVGARVPHASRPVALSFLSF